MRISDWSSDVCSSDLQIAGGVGEDRLEGLRRRRQLPALQEGHAVLRHQDAARRQAGLRLAVEALAEQHLARAKGIGRVDDGNVRSEEHTSELQSLMRISYAVFCLKKKKCKNKY